jgi:hypothetical protein
MTNDKRIPLWRGFQTNALAIGGTGFMIAAFVAMIVLLVILYKLSGFPSYRFPEYQIGGPYDLEYVSEKMVAEMVDHYLRQFLAPLIILVSMALAAGIGYFLLRAAGTAGRQVIPSQDYELLSDILKSEPDKAVDHYVRLSSLTGLTGLFTKIGLSGLPLATIGLTIVFTVLAMLVGGNGMGASFFDLAKLTLGAFLGSYVQRQTPPQHVAP